MHEHDTRALQIALIGEHARNLQLVWSRELHSRTGFMAQCAAIGKVDKDGRTTAWPDGSTLALAMWISRRLRTMSV